MKRVVISILAATALLVGCSKEDVTHNANPTITIKAKMSFDATSRTTIKEQDGDYLARWNDEDKYHIRLIGIGSDGAVWGIAAENIYLENGGETATFDFTIDSDMTADSYTFIAVNSYAIYANNSKTVWLELKNEQSQDWLGYYDPYTDLIASKPIVVERPSGNLNLNFTMARINSLLKLSLKNLTLVENEEIKSVTFACEQPLAGEISVNFADLDGVTYPIPYTLTKGSESKSITFNLQSGGDLYISTLPATLKAGENYTVSVVTNQGTTYQKSATLPADLKLTAGDITAVTVNMSGITPTVPNN